MIIEQTVIEYLMEKLNIPAYAERPEKSTDSFFLIVERVGGSEQDFMRTAQVSVRSYAPSMYECSVLNEKVNDVMRDFDTVENISHCGVESNANYTDTQRKEYRSQTIFNIKFME